MKDLLLLHGATGSAAQFEKLAGLLKKDYNVHALNFPGHGGAEMPGNFSIDFFAAHVKEYCLVHSIQHPLVFGYSMGGYVALYLETKNPGFFERIATLGTMFHWNEEIAAKESAKLKPEIIEVKVPNFAAALEKMHLPNNWKEVLEKTAAMLSDLGRKNLLAEPVLKQVSTPVMIMLGDRDKMVSMEKTLEVYQTLLKAELAVLPGTPHPLEICDADLLVFLLKKFFTDAG